MTEKYFFIYPEDKNGKRTGHTICILVDSVCGETKVFHGISLCSPKDQFEYTKGREKALKRAETIRDNHILKKLKAKGTIP